MGSLGAVIVIGIISGLVVALVVSLCWMQTYKKEKKMLLEIFRSTLYQLTAAQLEGIAVPYIYGDVTNLHQDLEELRVGVIKEKKVTELWKK